MRFLILVVATGLALPCSAQSPAGAQRFAAGVIDTDADEYGPTFSPDGRTLYFTRRADRNGNETIMKSTRQGSGWTKPVPASFSGTYYDKEPFVSPDGTRIFFASTRDDPPGGDDLAFDIWMAEADGDSWGDPVRLGAEVNSADYDNYPSVAANGNLYFGSRREGGLGRLDLYVSRFVGGRYMPAENLGETINSAATEADPYIAPDESYLIYCSTRPGGAGSGDLYISFRQADGSWTAPESLGPLVNLESFDYTPLITPDGSRLLFSRDWGEIWELEVSELPVSLER